MPPESLPARTARFYQDLAMIREQALPSMGEIFASDITFTDPLQEAHGLTEFRGLFTNMFRRYETLWFDGFDVVSGDGDFALHYTMTMAMGVGPIFRVDMVSVYWTRDGKVYRQIDNYDVASTLFSSLPLADKIYRALVGGVLLG